MEYSVLAMIWMLKLLVIYTLLVVIMPYILLRPMLRGKAVSLQFLICVIFGNFYYINIVLFLGLFHITSGKVYFFLLLLPFIIKSILMRKRIQEKYIAPFCKRTMGVIHGEISIKFCMRQLVRWLKKSVKMSSLPMRRVLRRNSLEVILFGICMLVFLAYFSPNFYEHYGYKASDIVVHQQWINALEEGILFSDGIYPMGMHAIIYYIHAVFGIHTYIVMQFFSFVSAIYVFCMVVVTLKTLCRFRYLPYIGFFGLVATDYIHSRIILRYLAALPQEFGMLFYLPCLVAAIQFFRTAMREETSYQKLKEDNLLYTVIGQKTKRKESTLWLWVLLCSFGLTFSVHFYVTILAGLLMVAVAIGYIRYVFKPVYLKRLVVAAIVSILIPLTPMVIAYMQDVPLQGSLYWASSVMGVDLHEKMSGVSSDEDQETSGDLSDQEETIPVDASVGKEKSGSWINKLQNVMIKIKDSIHTVWVDEYAILKDEKTYQIMVGALALLCIQIICMFWLKEREYRRIITIILVNQCLLMLMGIAEKIGLPVLIDAERMVAFQAYALPLTIVLAIDSLLVMGRHLLKKQRLWQGISFALTISFIGYSILCGHVRKTPPMKSNIQTDGAAVSLSDILTNYPEDKWTIVSCNEERNMMAGSGWHYEVIDFLHSMERYDVKDVMQIPTQYVFFFIEKESLNYARGEWEDSIDPTVSEAWAEKRLPRKHGIDQYQGTDRIILNSRMYYWMQEYKKRYPNDIKVYYEDDEFICYFMEQNEYYLHNFAIDYGYNKR